MKKEGNPTDAPPKKKPNPKASRKPMGRPTKEEALRPAALRKLTAEAYYRWIKNMEKDFNRMDFRTREMGIYSILATDEEERKQIKKADSRLKRMRQERK